MLSKLQSVFCLTGLVGGLLLAPGTRANCQDLTLGSVPQGDRSGVAGAANPAQWRSEPEPTHRRPESGLPNFGEMNDHVWRSGQPTRRGFERLVEMGVKTIVNLRLEFPQEKDLVPPGVRYFQIPITDETAPTQGQATEFLDIVTNPKNWPVLVHCKAGEGRTGVMCALIRYSIDGWDDSRIRTEVSNFRQAYLGLLRIPMCGRQRRFIAEWEAGNRSGACGASITSPHPAAKE